MSSLLWLALLAAVYGICRWSGRLLDSHYADRVELGAVALVAISVLAPVALGAGEATLFGVPLKLFLLVAVVGGLVSGGRARAT